MNEEGVVMPQVHSLFANLKSELKAKGLTYKDVAEHLELTETSVKRLFSAEDMTLKRLDSICDLLGVDLAELARGDGSDSRAIGLMSEEQEKEIVSDERMLAVSFLVYTGWTFEDILKYFDFTEPELIGKLTRLDKMGLIELQPRNRIKLRVANDLSWRKRGPVHKAFVDHFQNSFMQNYFDKEGEYLRLMSGMYAPLTCSLIMRKLQKLAFEIFQLHQEDKKLSVEERIPFGALVAARPWHAEFFDNLRRQEVDE